MKPTDWAATDEPRSPAGDARLAPVSARSLSEEIAEALVRAAAEGKFALGERLYEPALARDLGVSRIPVREALRLLTGRGIVVATPGRGMRFMAVDSEELRHILAVRASLECLAIREARAQPGRGDWTGMERALGDMGKAAATRDAWLLAKSDVEFHRCLCRASGNATLLGIWETLATRLRIIVGIATRDKDFDRYHRNHQQLFDTLRKGTLDAASAAAESHILEEKQWKPVIDRLQSTRPAIND
jgi:DNA-binding GntR family transcriptional regulator